MFNFKKIVIQLILVLFFVNSCTTLPGINENPRKKKPNKKLEISEYSIEDVKMNLIKINKLSDEQIVGYSKDKYKNLDYEIRDYLEIYDYRYEYILGSSDIININLTDTNDLDGTYQIDENGMIDLPFIGKVNLNNLTINEAHNVLLRVIKRFYRNPDLQISITEYNSSNAYIVGAVRNQITISLNQKPITLIEAAIQANFNPSAEDKLFGTSGLLRRDGQVYKIN